MTNFLRNFLRTSIRNGISSFQGDQTHQDILDWSNVDPNSVVLPSHTVRQRRDAVRIMYSVFCIL